MKIDAGARPQMDTVKYPLELFATKLQCQMWDTAALGATKYCCCRFNQMWDTLDILTSLTDLSLIWSLSLLVICFASSTPFIQHHARQSDHGCCTIAEITVSHNNRFVGGDQGGRTDSRGEGHRCCRIQGLDSYPSVQRSLVQRHSIARNKTHGRAGAPRTKPAAGVAVERF